MPAPGPPRLPTVLATLAVLYAGLCKALLFRDLEYMGSDTFSFLEMTWSWYFSGLFLHDNAYGYHYALHNFYLLLAFFPLTLPLGAYGLILGLVLLHLAAVLRVARAPRLDVPRRLAVLAGALGPVAYYVYDHPNWGFHPELCYPPLALLLAVELIEERPRWAALWALLIVLVKEDGAVLAASILLAYFAGRLWTLRAGPRDERRRVARTAALSLLAVSAAFVVGLAILSAASRELASSQETSHERVTRSVRKVLVILSGEGRPMLRENLEEALLVYGLVSLLVLLPLGRRFGRGVVLLLLAAPPLLATLVVSSAIYNFTYMLWPPRLATMLALVVACLALGSRPDGPADAALRPSTVALGLLVAASWGLQLLLLSRLGYSPWPRLDAAGLLSGRAYRVATIPPSELRFLRCLAGRLPRGLPIASVGDTHPVFHHQSVVFPNYLNHAWHHPPRLQVILASEAVPAPDGTICRSPRVGTLALEGECGLFPRVADCASAPEPEP